MKVDIRTRQLYIGKQAIPYEEKKSALAKRIIISVLADRIRVTFPKGVSIRQVRNFVESQQEWILKHWHSQSDSLGQAIKRDFAAGEQYPFRGKEIFVQARYDEGKTVRAKWEDDRLMITLPSPETADSGELIIAALRKWYNRQARQVLTEKLNYYAAVMGVKYNELRIKEQKTRWGSCSSRGNINLNWRIILAPDPVIDYLVIHELAHLRYPHHGKEYWQYVARLRPDYMELRKWLKLNGQSLVI